MDPQSHEPTPPRCRQPPQSLPSSPLPPQTGPDGGDLHATLPLSPQEARRGTTRTIKLPGGRHTRVVVPAGAFEGQILSLEGLGDPTFPGGPRGTLTLTLTIPSAAPPAETARPTHVRRTPAHFPRLAASRVLLLLGAVLLLALTGMGSLYLLAGRHQAAGPATPPLRTAATRLPTRTALATATAASTPSPTPVPPRPSPPALAPPRPTPRPPYPPANAQLVLTDPWRASSPLASGRRSEGCWRAADGYHVAHAVSLSTYFCTTAATTFSTLVYEVQMRLLQGNGGGLIFRANAASGTFYYFYLTQGGQYQLLVYAGARPVARLAQGWSASFQTGPGQPNRLAVVAAGDDLQVYVNQSLTVHVRDDTYRQGHIGVAASTQAGPVEAVFSQARVWTF
jgi:hypothetical protein